MNIIIYNDGMYTNELIINEVCVNPTDNKNYIVKEFDDIFNEWDVVDVRYGRHKSFKNGQLIRKIKTINGKYI
jgi:hypothetical protein